MLPLLTLLRLQFPIQGAPLSCTVWHGGRRDSSIDGRQSLAILFTPAYVKLKDATRNLFRDVFATFFLYAFSLPSLPSLSIL